MSYPTTTCPHCGQPFANSSYSRHVRGCLADPTVFAAVRDLLDAGGGVIVTTDAYRALPGAPIAQGTLQQRFGSWGGVAAAFGLVLVDPREAKWAQPLPAPVAEPSPPRGLPVLRVVADDRWPGYVRCTLR